MRALQQLSREKSRVPMPISPKPVLPPSAMYPHDVNRSHVESTRLGLGGTEATAGYRSHEKFVPLNGPSLLKKHHAHDTSDPSLRRQARAQSAARTPTLRAVDEAVAATAIMVTRSLLGPKTASCYQTPRLCLFLREKGLQLAVVMATAETTVAPLSDGRIPRRAADQEVRVVLQKRIRTRDRSIVGAAAVGRAAYSRGPTRDRQRRTLRLFPTVPMCRTAADRGLVERGELQSIDRDLQRQHEGRPSRPRRLQRGRRKLSIPRTSCINRERTGFTLRSNRDPGHRRGSGDTLHLLAVVAAGRTVSSAAGVRCHRRRQLIVDVG